MMIKKSALGGLLTFLIYSLNYQHWQTEWKYTLPGPVPQSYLKVKTSASIKHSGILYAAGKESVFLHFFNPGCLCLRFNIPQIKPQTKKYAGKINFTSTVVSNEPDIKSHDNHFKPSLQSLCV